MGVLQGVLMVLRQGVPVGLRRVASVGPRMGGFLVMPNSMSSSSSMSPHLGVSVTEDSELR